MTESTRTYGTSSSDYLQRAAACLSSGRREALFYAAFELRAGVEARLREYLGPRDDVNAKLKDGWEIPKLARGVDPTGDWGDRVFAWRVLGDTACGGVLRELYYTPVSEQLRRMAGKLGGYLHAAGGERDDDDPWWNETRGLLVDTAVELGLATYGTLLAVPVRKVGGDRVKMYVELHQGHDVEVSHLAGSRLDVSVEHLDALPSTIEAAVRSRVEADCRVVGGSS